MKILKTITLLLLLATTSFAQDVSLLSVPNGTNGTPILPTPYNGTYFTSIVLGTGMKAITNGQQLTILPDAVAVTPYIIPFAANITIDLANGDYQYLNATSATVITLPVGNTNFLHSIRVDLRAYTNMITITNCTLTANFAITNNGVTPMIFDSPYSTNAWRGSTMP